jgi:hypothetical protein
MREKKKTARVKFETKLYKLEIRRAEKDTLRRLLAQESASTEMSAEDEDALNAGEALPVERLVADGISQASQTRAHPHTP